MMQPRLGTWPYNMVVTAAWTDGADSDSDIRWTREFWEAMRPYLAQANSSRLVAKRPNTGQTGLPTRSGVMNRP